MDKQIEEMAKVLCINDNFICKTCPSKNDCFNYKHAKQLYNAGYGKVREPVIRNGEVVGFVNGADYVPKNLFIFGIANTRKETAEKFAEMARVKSRPAYVNIDDIQRKDSFILLSDIDEICKKITEGRYDTEHIST